MFGLIEAVLSGGHQVIDSGALIYGRHPHTEGDSQLISLGLHINFGGLGAQALGNINCGLGIGCWQQHHKFIAAPARHHILVAQRLEQHLAHGVENLIPHIMTIAIINKLKIIQICQQN